MPQRICSNDSNQFSSFTIWYARGTDALFPFTDSPMLKLGADLQYLLSLGRTPIVVQEFSPDGYQFLATSALEAYVASFGVGLLHVITGGENPVGSITDDGFPTCYPITPVGTGLCPPGYVYDVATEQCVPLPPPPPTIPPPIPPTGPPPGPPPPGPPPNPPPPPLGQPDPQGDEIVDTLCRQIAADTAAIVHSINQLQGDGGLGAAACCAAIVNAIAGVEATLIRILTVLPTLAPGKAPPLDVAAVITELTCICEQLTALAGSSSAIPTSLDTGLKSISDAIAKGTDVSQIVDQLKTANQLQDVPHAIIAQMFGDKVIPKQYSGLLQGTPASWIHAVLQAAAAVSPIIGFLEHLAGDDADLEGGERMASAWVTTMSATLAKMAKEVGGMPSAGPPTDLAKGFRAFLTVNDALLHPVVGPLIDAITKTLKPAPGTNITLGNIGVNADTPVSSATGVALTAGLAAWVLSFAGIDEGESLTHIAELIAGAIGWEELKDVQIRPLIQYGLERIAEMEAKSTFRQELPGAGALAALAGRGLITTDRYGQIAPLTGVPAELQGPTLEAGQSGLNARMMLRLVGTGLFSDADVVDELTFAGMRQSSQHRLVVAAAYLGTEPERGKLRGALESAYRAGMISDNEFVSRLQSAEHNTDRTNLLLETVQLEKQVVLAKEYEAAYSREFLAGLLDTPGYQSALEALGMQPPDVAARMFRDETHLNVTTSIQAARQARALQRAEASAERKTAIEAYRTGNSNEAALAAALLATGLSSTQVAAQTSYQVLASAGVLRWIFGLKLPPEQATLLRQRVADLTRQREIELVTDAQYVSALTALGIPQNYINALRAGANAHVSPKTAAILTPVSTT